MVDHQQRMSRDKISRLVSWGHWFALFNGILAMLIGLRYIADVGFPDTLLAWGYLGIYSLGHFCFLAFMVYLVLLFPISTLLPYSKILRGYAATLATISLSLLAYDTVIYDDYRIHLTPIAFELAWSDLGNLFKNTSYVATPLIILAFELVLANFLWRRVEQLQKQHLGQVIVGIIGFSFIASHLIHIWADATQYSPITRYDESYPVAYPATAKSFIAKQGINPPPIAGKGQTDNELNYPSTPLQCHNSTERNILLITIDGLRADMVNAQTMPFFSQYAASNIELTQHYSGGNQYQSGLFSLLYGLQGSYLNAVDFEVKAPLISQAFLEQGYQLQAFLTEEANDSLNPVALLDHFELNLVSAQSAEKRVDKSEAMQDSELSQRFQTWQAQHENTQQAQPWFALLNFMSPQSYSVPDDYFVAELPNVTDKNPAKQVLIKQYQQSLRYIDGLLQQTLAELPEETVVVITGVRGKIFTTEQGHASHDLSPASVQVPMVIHVPSTPARQLNHLSNHDGLVPTLMNSELSCINPATDYSSGQYLLQPNNNQWSYIGDHQTFALYQPEKITLIDGQGNYCIYDHHFNPLPKAKLNAPVLIEAMQEGQRFYK